MKINPLRGRRFIVVFALLGALAAAAVFGVTASSAGAAPSHSGRFVSRSASALITRVYQGAHAPSFVAPNAAAVACSGNTPLYTMGPCPIAPPPGDAAAPASSFYAQAHRSLSISGNAGPTLGTNFLGITDVSQHADYGYHVTPPDQGLCVGAAGPLETAFGFSGPAANQSVIFEMTNMGVAVYDTSGNLLFHTTMNTLFQDPYALGDPECSYDRVTGAWFFTEIGAPNGLYYTTGLTVIDGHGVAIYNVDTSGGGGYCFPDFPHQGSDTNALYITVNEFCGPNQDSYGGANIYAVAKSQLVALTNANMVAFSTGVLNFTWRPADGAGKTEYLLASDQNAASANDLQIAWVTGDNKVATGGGPITLSMTSIASEPYSEPVDAPSTGNDTTCMQTFHTDPGQPDDQTWCSVPEATINSVDDRLEQVQYVNGQLITSLSTSLTFPNDANVYDGAAWFVIDPVKLKVVKQNYVASQGTWLLMPSFIESKYDKTGKASHFIMSFSMTSPTMNPSTGYVTSVNSGKSFSSIATTAAGSGPHVSFSTMEPGYMRRRWGDYSRIAIDPANGSVWSADEFVPPGFGTPGTDGGDTVDNWGTQVWQLSK